MIVPKATPASSVCITLCTRILSVARKGVMLVNKQSMPTLRPGVVTHSAHRYLASPFRPFLPSSLATLRPIPSPSAMQNTVVRTTNWSAETEGPLIHVKVGASTAIAQQKNFARNQGSTGAGAFRGWLMLVSRRVGRSSWRARTSRVAQLLPTGKRRGGQCFDYSCVH